MQREGFGQQCCYLGHSSIPTYEIRRNYASSAPPRPVSSPFMKQLRIGDTGSDAAA
jgi:hypothetical protein